MNETLLDAGEERRNIILAALAELSAAYLTPEEAEDSAPRATEKTGGLVNYGR